MTSSQRLRATLLCFLLGIFASFYSSLFAFLVSCVLLGIWLGANKNVFLLFGVSFIFGGSLVYYQQKNLQSLVSPYFKKEVQIYGTLNRFPENRQTQMYIYIHAKEICEKEICREIEEGVLVRSNLKDSFDYGDQGWFVGKLSSPRSFSGFDYESFLKRLKVYSILDLQEFSLENKGKGFWFNQWAYDLRKKFQKNISDFVSYPYNVLAEGVLLGVKESFPPLLAHFFRQAGLQHIIVVSGFNVSVIILLLLALFRPLGPQVTFVFITLAVMGFIALTGSDPPVIRAGIMGIIGVYALWRGKTSDALHALLFAGVLVGMWNPYLVRYDLGFQLSFIATLSIILGGKFAEKKLAWIPQPLCAILSISTVAQLAVLPFIGSFFESVPVGGFIANIIVEPLVPMLMLSGFLTGFFGGFFSSLAEFLGMITEGIAASVFWIARVFSFFPSLVISPIVFKSFLCLEIAFFVWLILRNQEASVCNMSEKREDLQE